jgi:hypothetical protein
VILLTSLRYKIFSYVSGVVKSERNDVLQNTTVMLVREPTNIDLVPVNSKHFHTIQSSSFPAKPAILLCSMNCSLSYKHCKNLSIRIKLRMFGSYCKITDCDFDIKQRRFLKDKNGPVTHYFIPGR